MTTEKDSFSLDDAMDHSKKEQKETVNKYFTGNKFIPKTMGDEILEECNIITLQDTKELLLYENGVYDRIHGEDNIRYLILEKLEEQYVSLRINEVINYIKIKTLIDRVELNKHKYLINVKNGMYDVKNDKLLSHDPCYHSTIQVNVKYNTDAQCVNIHNFLHEITSIEEVMVLVQFCGYCFIPDISQQRGLLIQGHKRNGKSTFLEMLDHAIGENHVAQQSIQALNNERFAKAQLNGKLVNIFPDLPAKKLYDNSVFKMLTTEKKIWAEEKYIKGFHFENITRQVYSANKIPPVQDEEESSFFRRWIIVEFPNEFEGKKADKNKLELITTDEEISGFFNIAMIALRALLDNGDFCYIKSDDEVKKLYIIKSDPISSFLGERVVYSESDYPKQALYEDFIQWCDENNVKTELKNNSFGRKMKKLNYDDDREGFGDRKHVWRNISVQVPVQYENSTWTVKNRSTANVITPFCPCSQDNKSIVSKYYKERYSEYYNIIKTFHGEPGHLDGSLDSEKNQEQERPKNENIDDLNVKIPGHGVDGNQDGIIPDMPSIPQQPYTSVNIPKLPRTAQKQLIKSLRDFKNDNYRSTPASNLDNNFLADFMKAHEIYKNTATRVKAMIKNMTITNDWS